LAFNIYNLLFDIKPKEFFALICDMLERGLLLFFVVCLIFAFPAFPQTADSLKKADSLKIDTSLLNKYRIDPHKNALPLRTRPVQIHEELIPVSMLDFKVNYWRKWIKFGININQSAFSSNWSNGGISSLAIGGNFDYKTEYNKAPFDYTGELLMQYGTVANRGQIARKTNDRLFLDNKIATQLSKKWFFFGSLTFESQFDKGYKYSTEPVLISRFMAPGYITESVGVEYKPNKFFDLRIGTGTARQTFVLDTTIYHQLKTNYGVLPGHTFKNELAFQVVSTYDKDIMQNLHLNARYAGFIPYGRGWVNIDHRLDVTLTAKVNRLINVNVTGTVLYDHDTSKKPQGTEGLALGIIYKFP
jgi:hypothetical protein